MFPTLYSIGGRLAASMLLCILTATDAIATDYSTESAEPQLVTVSALDCCADEQLKKNSTVRLDILPTPIRAAQPPHIVITDKAKQTVMEFTTRDRVAFIRIPDGEYDLSIKGSVEQNSIPVTSAEGMLNQYEL